MRKHEYVYDEFHDCYICPEGQVLPYRTTTRDGYKQYASNPDLCKDCPLLNQCTQSQNHMKMIHRYLWEHYEEEADL